MQKSWVFQKSGDFAIEHGRFLVVILGYTGDFPIKNGDVPPKKRDELPGTGDIWGYLGMGISWGSHPSVQSTSQFCHVPSGYLLHSHGIDGP